LAVGQVRGERIFYSLGAICLALTLDSFPDDVFKSTLHRAINVSPVDRYSIPLFFGVDYDTRLEVKLSCRSKTLNIHLLSVPQPIPSCVSADRPYKYEIMTAGELVQARSKATYGHY
jgi:hypothetical protein